MCLMCVEIAKGKMTIGEARRALSELIGANQTQEDRTHYEELQKGSDEDLLKKAQSFKIQPSS